MVSFGQIWLDLGEIRAKVIRFGKNLASPKTIDLLWLWFAIVACSIFSFNSCIKAVPRERFLNRGGGQKI